MSASDVVNGVELRGSRPSEAETISALALRSKGYWGYSDAFLEACRAELTVTPEQCGSGLLVVAVANGNIIGYSRLDGCPPDGELAALFVDPDGIGEGVGKLLLHDALARAADLGFRRLIFASDPGAESFYAKHGAEKIGTVESDSIPGRMLPRMRFSLA